MRLLRTRNVTFGYTDQPVLENISFSVSTGDVISLLGPNGSGKTTLLKILLNFYTPQTGEVLLEDRPVARIPRRQLARRMAYVPQGHQLSFGYRVLDVVLMGRISRKPFFFRYGKTDEDASAAALERLGIGHLADRPYTEVSGGERQLVLIARALAQGADIFVMDEPVTGLDYGNQIRLLDRITELAQTGYTFIKTTHFPDHALRISNKVVMLKNGHVVAHGPTRQVMTSDNLFQLYHTPIEVRRLGHGERICVPMAGKVQGNAEFKVRCSIS